MQPVDAGAGVDEKEDVVSTRVDLTVVQIATSELLDELVAEKVGPQDLTLAGGAGTGAGGTKTVETSSDDGFDCLGRREGQVGERGEGIVPSDTIADSAPALDSLSPDRERSLLPPFLDDTLSSLDEGSSFEADRSLLEDHVVHQQEGNHIYGAISSSVAQHAVMKEKDLVCAGTSKGTETTAAFCDSASDAGASGTGLYYGTTTFGSVSTSREEGTVRRRDVTAGGPCLQEDQEPSKGVRAPPTWSPSPLETTSGTLARKASFESRAVLAKTIPLYLPEQASLVLFVNVPDILRPALGDQHHVGTDGKMNPLLPQYNPSFVDSEMSDTEYALRRALGVSCCARLPRRAAGFSPRAVAQLALAPTPITPTPFLCASLLGSSRGGGGKPTTPCSGDSFWFLPLAFLSGFWNLQCGFAGTFVDAIWDGVAADQWNEDDVGTRKATQDFFSFCRKFWVRLEQVLRVLFSLMIVGAGGFVGGFVFEVFEEDIATWVFN